LFYHSFNLIIKFKKLLSVPIFTISDMINFYGATAIISSESIVKIHYMKRTILLRDLKFCWIYLKIIFVDPSK